LQQRRQGENFVGIGFAHDDGGIDAHQSIPGFLLELDGTGAVYKGKTNAAVLGTGGIEFYGHGAIAGFR
jgi:hypothetical protein